MSNLITYLYLFPLSLTGGRDACSHLNICVTTAIAPYVLILFCKTYSSAPLHS